jgi:hypothetical protein
MATTRSFVLVKQDASALEPMAISGGRRLRASASRSTNKVKVSQVAPDCARFASRTLIGQELAQVMFLGDFFPELGTPMARRRLCELDAAVFITDVEHMDPSCALMLSVSSQNPEVKQLCRLNRRATAMAPGKKVIYGPVILASWHSKCLQPTEMLHEYLPVTEESKKALAQNFGFLCFASQSSSGPALRPPTARRVQPGPAAAVPSRAALPASELLAVLPPPPRVVPMLGLVPPPGLAAPGGPEGTAEELKVAAPRPPTLERTQSLGDTGATDVEGEEPTLRVASLQLELEARVSGMAHVVEQARLLLFPQVLEGILGWIVENQAAEGAELLENLEELAAHACMKPMARSRLARALAAEYGPRRPSGAPSAKC